MGKTCTASVPNTWHWKNVVRDGEPEGDINVSSVTEHYPSKAQEIGDEPVSDRGGNFGRFARTGLMDEFMDELFTDDLAGIPLDSWQRFLKLFGEQTPAERINRELDRMAREAAGRRRAATREDVEALRERLREVVELLDRL